MQYRINDDFPLILGALIKVEPSPAPAKPSILGVILDNNTCPQSFDRSETAALDTPKASSDWYEEAAEIKNWFSHQYVRVGMIFHDFSHPAEPGWYLSAQLANMSIFDVAVRDWFNSRFCFLRYWNGQGWSRGFSRENVKLHVPYPIPTDDDFDDSIQFWAHLASFPNPN